jgi:ribosome-binding factor A
VREVVAEELVRIDDDRLAFVTITSIDVDSEMNRGIVYYDSLQGVEGDYRILEALGEHRKRLQSTIANQIHARRTPILEFRPDEAIRAAAEELAVMLAPKLKSRYARKFAENPGTNMGLRGEWRTGMYNPPEFNEAFWKWFGDSKVVDKNGDPLVVYHGSKTEFDIFDRERGDLGWHFGTKSAASHAASDKYGSMIRPFYLSIHRLLRMKDINRWKDPIHVYQRMTEKGLQFSEFTKYKLKEDRVQAFNAIREELAEMGYDGIVYMNKVEDAGKLSYIAFYPTQIKSATGNDGTWDADDPDIRHNPPDAKTLIGTSEDGSLEFHLVEGDVYRVKAGWSPDVYGLPMGMRWECSLEQWNRYRNSVFSWVIDAGDLDPGGEE